MDEGKYVCAGGEQRGTCDLGKGQSAGENDNENAKIFYIAPRPKPAAARCWGPVPKKV